MPSPLAVVGRLIHSGAPPLAFGAARWPLLPDLFRPPPSRPIPSRRWRLREKKLHQYFLGNSAPFRIERDFRTMQFVFYGDFVPMGYVCIVPLWGWCDKTMYLHCRG